MPSTFAGRRHRWPGRRRNISPYAKAAASSFEPVPCTAPGPVAAACAASAFSAAAAAPPLLRRLSALPRCPPCSVSTAFAAVRAMPITPSAASLSIRLSSIGSGAAPAAAEAPSKAPPTPSPKRTLLIVRRRAPSLTSPPPIPAPAPSPTPAPMSVLLPLPPPNPPLPLAAAPLLLLLLLAPGGSNHLTSSLGTVMRPPDAASTVTAASAPAAGFDERRHTASPSAAVARTMPSAEARSTKGRRMAPSGGAARRKLSGTNPANAALASRSRSALMGTTHAQPSSFDLRPTSAPSGREISEPPWPRKA